jgi:hypothetical protein
MNNDFSLALSNHVRTSIVGMMSQFVHKIPEDEGFSLFVDKIK